MKATDQKIPRFDVAERVAHWLAALSFLYTALTGLALWSHKLYWLAYVFGGGAVVRGLHPWGGVIFVAALGMMFRRWAKQMRLDAEDREWLRQSHKYAVHDEEGLPDAGRFNAGQKMLFWLQSCSAAVLLVSGVVLWFPETMPRVLRLAAVLIHPLAAIASIGGIIVHIYMGTAAVPEAFRGMIQGWVRPGWAASHHPKWYREVKARSGKH
ncbi:MAG: formate dehydrogenase subunit gamma [Bryobacterales bacterium]|nr:formate dehydrogenase subunit gamma [Bryobacterales bacterium]